MSDNAATKKLGRPRNAEKFAQNDSANSDEVQDAEVISSEVKRDPPADTEEIKIELTIPVATQPEPETVTDATGTKVNFMNDSKADEIFGRRAEAYVEPQPELQETMDTEAEEISSTINPPKPAFSAQELEDVSQFGIEMIDSFMSFGFSKLAGEETTEKYELPQTKKKKLADMLSIILEKRNLGASLSIEMMFFVTFCLAYAPMAKKAMDNKKRNESTSNKARNSIR
jgi:hypothetical protein